jgi:hypothetical protein
MNSLLLDARHGLRSLYRSRGFTGIAVCTLVLGIGANTSIFRVVEAVVLRRLPYKDPGRLVLLSDSHNAEDGGSSTKISTLSNQRVRRFRTLLGITETADFRV